MQLEGLTIFTAGSYARLEASSHSDIDLFFTYHPISLDYRHTNELKLFGRLIDVIEDMGFPALSNDAQYLQTHSVGDILTHLGSPDDDASNRFTLRMLLLLESKPLWGDDEYYAAIRSIITAYYRDFPQHADDFQPWFLINDIVRYWKTLLLNYENKRNRGDSEQKARAQRVRNFKLKFSRMTTCFATLASLGSFSKTVAEDDVFLLVQLTPLDRLKGVGERVPGAARLIDDAIEMYSWFLEQTSLPTEALESRFDSTEGRQMMFRKADDYGSLMYDILSVIDAESKRASKFMRFLVV